MEKRNPRFIKPPSDNVKSKAEMVFGTRAVMEAIKAGKELERIMVQRDLRNELIYELLELATEKNIPITKVPAEKLNQISRKNHQGVISFISSIRYVSLDEIIQSTFEKGEAPFILVLDRITDVRNFGAIARSAECAGIHGIVIPDKGAAQITADAIKTSAGALNHISVSRQMSLVQTIQHLKNSGLKVIACTEKADTSIYKEDMTGPVAIIMGSEEDGITPELIRKSDRLVKIPQFGKIGSLNVSVASAVVIYEAVRQRSGSI